MSLKGVPRIYGPQVRDGVLMPELLNVILAMWRELQSLDTSVTEVEEAAAATTAPVSYYGTNGIQVFANGEIRGPGTVTGSGGVPYFVAEDSTLSVALNMQALFSLPIDIEGDLAVDGYLVEV